MASSSLFLQFLVLLFLPLLLISPSYAQSHRNVSLGSSLTPFGRNTSGLSPSGEFAFGFHPLEADHNVFLLAIWFEKIAEKTVVWYANGGQPMQNGSMAELTADGKLLLKDHCYVYNDRMPRALQKESPTVWIVIRQPRSVTESPLESSDDFADLASRDPTSAEGHLGSYLLLQISSGGVYPRDVRG